MTARFLLGLVALVPTVAQSRDSVRLQPTSPWAVDYAENSCRLIRTFGNGNDQVKIAFESEAPDDMDLLAFGGPLETVQQNVDARFLPTGGRPLTGRVARTGDGSAPAIYWRVVPMLPDAALDRLKRDHDRIAAHPGVRPPPNDPAEAASLKAERNSYADASRELAIQATSSRTVVLETGSLGAPMRALDKCNRDSLKDWGVDAELEDKIVRPAFPIRRDRWLGPQDYPRSMLWQGKEAVIAVRLLVDAAGRPTKCTTLSHFADKDFDKIGCDRIMERARFEPAELADGTKVPSYYATRLVFRIRP